MEGEKKAISQSKPNWFLSDAVCTAAYVKQFSEVTAALLSRIKL